MSETQTTPSGIAQGEPPSQISAANAQTRLIIEALKTHADSTAQDKRSDSNFRFILVIFGAGVVLLGSMIAAAYLKLADKIESQGVVIQRIDTRLEDLIARVPAVPTPVPTKR